MNLNVITDDLKHIQDYPQPPVKRAAYSDRVAWLMAILAELAYTPFDQEDNNLLLSLAQELAELTDQDKIAERLKNLAKLMNLTDRDPATEDNATLRGALNAGGFELKGVLFDDRTDTQGYVAVRRSDDGRGMAVLVFRGTKQIKDWMTNLDAATEPIYSSDGKGKILGKVHRGFNSAFLSVKPKIDRLLEDDKDLPLFITGHSLGGALATVATWYLSGDRLAACYTFGAPRVGDSGLMDRFRTPIYRLVNGIDPVPFVPPSGMTVTCLKHIFRVISIFFSPTVMVVDFLIKRQGYRHFGYQRYLTICKEGSNGDFPKLRLEFSVSPIMRLSRFVFRLFRGEFTRGPRLDKYHNMDLYRAKLRAFAKMRQQKP